MAKLIFLQNMDYPLLGLMHMSSMLKRHGHECDALIGQSIGDFLPILQVERPDMIGFSVMTGMHQWARELSRQLKQAFPDTLIVWGGPHPTFKPDIISDPGVDVICRGEADEAIVDLANAVQEKSSLDSIPNFWVKTADGQVRKNDPRPLLEDLDRLPFPDRTLYRRYPKAGSSTTQIFMASRGCPFDCTFCFNHQLMSLYKNKGRFVRYRTVPNLLAEIREVVANGNVRNIYLNDDTLILNRKWMDEFLEAYGSEIALPFTCLIRADLTSEDLIRRMAGAGCRSVFFGIETGNEALRNGLLKKKVEDKHIVETARLLKQYGIKFRTYNILGLPGETLEDAFKTVEMNIRIGTEFPWAAIFMPYPGTELGDYSMRTGLLDPAFSDEQVSCTFHSTSVLKLEHRREIENLHKFFQTAVLFPCMFPLIKKLVRLPPNKIFVLWFTLVYGIVYIRSEARGWLHTIMFGLKNIRLLAPGLHFRRNKTPG
jgi:radical SAM superfamily enzyme YgiQ (UPF0313 family)